MTPTRIGASIFGGGDFPEEGRGDEEIREAFSHWAAGVTVVSARDGSRAEGMTVSAFSPLSLDPPLLLVCLSEDAPILSTIRSSGFFVVNLLTTGQRRDASVFADRGPLGTTLLPEEGEPVLSGSLASLVCSLHQEHPGGDHRIVVGRVERVELGEGDSPLLYWRRKYEALEDG